MKPSYIRKTWSNVFFNPTNEQWCLFLEVGYVSSKLFHDVRRVDWIQVCLFPANFRFNMAELMADSTEISSQNEENSMVQDEDQRARLTQFPQTRVRNMMKIDPDLHLANRESVFLLTRAAVSEDQWRFHTILDDSKFILMQWCKLNNLTFAAWLNLSLNI